MTCSICSAIAPSIVANTGRDDYLPIETRPLRKHKEHYSSLGTEEDLWECPECGMFYLYTTETAFTGSGNNDTDTLDRMTREQSDIVHAILSCSADPAAIEDAFFALPGIAFRGALDEALRKDRDFIALFIPRLVHEYAKSGQFTYGEHPTRDALHALIAKPTFAREILAATGSLPPELRKDLGDLEQRCQKALG